MVNIREFFKKDQTVRINSISIKKQDNTAELSVSPIDELEKTIELIVTGKSIIYLAAAKEIRINWNTDGNYCVSCSGRERIAKIWLTDF